MGRQAWVGWTERGRDELDVQDGRAYLRSRQERAQAGRLARSGSTYCGRAKSAQAGWLARSGSTYCGRAKSATVSAAIVSPSARLAPSRSSIRSSR